MYNNHIGEVIYELRMRMKVSQKELAEGICSQSFISRIEKGDISPSAELLYSISKKLGVDMNYYFEHKLNPRLDYQLDFCKQIRDYIQKAEYEPVRDLIMYEAKNPFFNTPDMQQFINWHEGICAYHLDGDFNGAIFYLKKALNLGKNKEKLHERQIEISISMANIYNEEKCYLEAEKYYNLAINRLNELKGFIDIKIFIRALYNYSKLLYRIEKNQESIETSTNGIKLCSEIESTYLLGNLLFQKGLSLEKVGEIANSIKIMKDAYAVFRIQKNHLFAAHVKTKIDNLTTASSY